MSVFIKSIKVIRSCLTGGHFEQAENYIKLAEKFLKDGDMERLKDEMRARRHKLLYERISVVIDAIDRYPQVKWLEHLLDKQ